jgi:hypothetical protein
MTGENVFELDFSKLSSAIKDAIVVDGKTYFRDEVEDYITGKIKINETIYSRDFEHDTCNAYAWSNTAAEISTVYTDTHIPDISEKARRGYDDFDELSDISEVSSYNMIGWTTERILESDYGESETVQTKENPSVGSAAYVDEE